MSMSTETETYTGIEDLIACMGFLEANKYYSSVKLDTTLSSYLALIPGSNNLNSDSKFGNIIYQQADRTANIRNIDKKILASSCSFFDPNPQPLNFVYYFYIIFYYFLKFQITRDEILNESKKYTNQPAYKDPEPIIKVYFYYIKQ